MSPAPSARSRARARVNDHRPVIAADLAPGDAEQVIRA